MLNLWPNMTLSKKDPSINSRDNTRPAFTPVRPSTPHELRPRATVLPERRSIILDGIHPRDFRELNIMYACEQCSYFNRETKRCAMGFKVEKHLRENQLALYYRTGKMAICRSQEID
jgi:hypothetical protein